MPTCGEDLERFPGKGVEREGHVQLPQARDDNAVGRETMGALEPKEDRRAPGPLVLGGRGGRGEGEGRGGRDGGRAPSTWLVRPTRLRW